MPEKNPTRPDSEEAWRNPDSGSSFPKGKNTAHGEHIESYPAKDFAWKEGHSEFLDRGKHDAGSRAFEDHVMHHVNGQMRDHTHFLNGTEHDPRGAFNKHGDLPHRSGVEQDADKGLGHNYVPHGQAGHHTK